MYPPARSIHEVFDYSFLFVGRDSPGCRYPRQRLWARKPSRHNCRQFGERYTKQEVQIPVRDGVKLFTAIYVPKDTSRKYPILMTRTPYSVAPYGKDAFRSQMGPSRYFSDEGYIFVYQDVRGCYMSEGDFVNMTAPPRPEETATSDIDESTDTYDTIDWLIKNVPNNNGQVGLYGISYPGFYSSRRA